MCFATANKVNKTQLIFVNFLTNNLQNGMKHLKAGAVLQTALHIFRGYCPHHIYSRTKSEVPLQRLGFRLRIVVRFDKLNDRLSPLPAVVFFDQPLLIYWSVKTPTIGKLMQAW